MPLTSWSRLSAHERQVLSAALEEAFPTRPDVEQLVSLTTDKTLDQIAGAGDPLGPTLLKVIQWFSARDRLNDLLDTARQQNPTNLALQNAAETIGRSQVIRATRIRWAGVIAAAGAAMSLLALALFGSRPAASAFVAATLTVSRVSFQYVPESRGDAPLLSHTQATRLVVSAFNALTLPAGVLTPCQTEPNGAHRAPLASGRFMLRASHRAARLTLGPALLAELNIPYASLVTLEPFTDTTADDDCGVATAHAEARPGTMVALKGSGGSASIRFGEGATVQCEGCEVNDAERQGVKIESGSAVRAVVPPRMPVTITAVPGEFVLGVVPSQPLDAERFHATNIVFCGRPPDARQSTVLSGVLRFPNSDAGDVPLDGLALRLGGSDAFAISNLKLVLGQAGSSTSSSSLTLTIEGRAQSIGIAPDCLAPSTSRMPLRWAVFTNHRWMVTACVAMGLTCAFGAGGFAIRRLSRRKISMTNKRALVVLAVTLAFSAPAMCQTAADLDALLNSVVKITSPGARQGSGIVVDVSDNVIHVITATHVVESSVQRPGAKPVDRRPCDVTPTVRFRTQPSQAITAASATCSDTMDFAVLDIPQPSTLQTLTPFHSPSGTENSVKSALVFLGAPADLWDRSADNVVEWNAFEQGQRPVSEVASVCLGTVSQGSTEGGYSGGAAVGRDLGLVGMIVQAEKQRSYLYCWMEIQAVLRRWQVPMSQLQPSQDRSAVRFTITEVGGLEESARNAVRAYREALVGKQRAALLAVYPSVNRSSVDALFGDATTIALDLHECTDVVGSETYQIACAYSMDIFRRTGGRSSDHFASTVPTPGQATPDPMVFELKRRSYRWEIVSIQTPPTQTTATQTTTRKTQ